VVPSIIDLPRVAAHYALAGPSEGYGDPAEVHAYRVERRQWGSVATAGATLALGRVRVTARVTGETQEADVAVVHTTTGETHCRVRTGADPESLGSARAALFSAFVGAGASGASRTLDRCFEGRSYGTEAVFLDERRRLLARLTEDGLPALAGDPDRRGHVDRLLAALRAESPVPPLSLAAAAPFLAGAIRDELTALGTDGAAGPRVDRIQALAAAARSLRIELGLPPEAAASRIESALSSALAKLSERVTPMAVGDTLALLALRDVLPAAPDLWAAQTEAMRLWRGATAHDRTVLAPLMTALGFAATALAIPRREH
jgi:hypothetical protein